MIRNSTAAAMLLIGFGVSATLAGAPRTPRVLALGDSVQIGILRAAEKELKGRVRFEFPKSLSGVDTGSVLSQVDEFLGDGKWDVICFNFGLADLHYKDPKTREIRSMSKHAGGVRVTSPEAYEKNLRALVERLQATNAKLLWVSTLPIPKSSNDGLYDPGSEIEYNAIAAKIMAERKIPVIDLHALYLANASPKQNSNLFAPSPVPLHPPIVTAIRTALDLPESP